MTGEMHMWRYLFGVVVAHHVTVHNWEKIRNITFYTENRWELIGFKLDVKLTDLFRKFEVFSYELENYLGFFH